MFKIFSTYICSINKKMQRLEVSGAVRPLKWPLGVKWLIIENSAVSHTAGCDSYCTHKRQHLFSCTALTPWSS
jgi:hypothetical protein